MTATIMNGRMKFEGVKMRDRFLKIAVILFLIACLVLVFIYTARAAEVMLKWDANDPTPDGYRIFQRVAGADYDYTTPVCDTQETQCTVNALIPATLYYFVARAYMGEDESGDSNEVNFKGSVPVPQNLTVQVELSVYIDENGNAVLVSRLVR